MSDHITFEIQVEIIKKLPVKSLIRFRSVSKPWKSLIDSSDFIADYSVHHSQPQRLLITYIDPRDSELEYVMNDDDTILQRKCSLDVPILIKSIDYLKIIGSSHGLLCLYRHCYGYGIVVLWNPSIRKSVVISRYHPSTHCYGYGIVVLWNPSIRKSVVIKLRKELHHQIETVVGFGVCPLTNDPKLVKINFISYSINWGSISCIPSQVEVFTLSSGAWRIPSINLPRKSIVFQCSHMVIGRFIYWAAFDRTHVDVCKGYNLIISFELTSEEFREIYLPEHLAHQSPRPLLVSKLRDSLVVLDSIEYFVYGVWIMEHGVPNSFKKLFTVEALSPSLSTLLGFRKNGKPVLEMDGMCDKFSTKLEAYELLHPKLIKELGIYGDKVNSFSVSSYMETLILLDKPDGSIYSVM